MGYKMKLTRSLLLIAGITLGGFTACNYTVGECYPRGQGSDNAGAVAGAGGSVVVPGGVGGFGDAPPRQPQDATNPPFDCNSHDTETPKPSMAGNPTLSVFIPSNFPFVITVADDGTDVAGGYQEATAGMVFINNLQGVAACVARIQMPLRTYAWGRVPPNIAAIYTAKVANAAAREAEGKGYYDLPSGVFCIKFSGLFQTQFDDLYKGMGASVKVKSP
jgi:hypothetical protein